MKDKPESIETHSQSRNHAQKTRAAQEASVAVNNSSKLYTLAGEYVDLLIGFTHRTSSCWK